jgi:hypothetical protein
MTANVFTPGQLSNEAYQQLPQRPGSFLHRLLVHSPAKARFGKQPASKALDFGIWSHAMILEPERFSQDYARDFDPSAYEQILCSGAAYKAWLKTRGLKTSGTNDELIARIAETGEPVHMYSVELQKYRATHPDHVEFIPLKEFDRITAMRHAIMLDEERAKMLAGGFPELSIVTDEFKARPDLITGGQWMVNYKSTLDAEPEKFSRKATDYGYPMRAVMECELFKQAYGEYPAGYAILAQEKDAPYLCKTFVIFERSRGDDQPSAWTYGRAQLADAVKIYRKCRDGDVWPGLGGAEDLSVPDYIMKKAGLA